MDFVGPFRKTFTVVVSLAITMLTPRLLNPRTSEKSSENLPTTWIQTKAALSSNLVMMWRVIDLKKFCFNPMCAYSAIQCKDSKSFCYYLNNPSESFPSCFNIKYPKSYELSLIEWQKKWFIECSFATLYKVKIKYIQTMWLIFILVCR